MGRVAAPRGVKCVRTQKGRVQCVRPVTCLSSRIGRAPFPSQTECARADAPRKGVYVIRAWNVWRTGRAGRARTEGISFADEPPFFVFFSHNPPGPNYYPLFRQLGIATQTLLATRVTPTSPLVRCLRLEALQSHGNSKSKLSYQYPRQSRSTSDIQKLHVKPSGYRDSTTNFPKYPLHHRFCMVIT